MKPIFNISHHTFGLKHLAFLLVILCSLSMSAQVPILSTSNGLPDIGETVTYSVDLNGAQVASYGWDQVNGGTLVSHSQGDLVLKVKWNSAGDHTVIFNYETTDGKNKTIESTVTAGSVAPDPPAIVDVKTENCEVTLTRGNPTDGSIWFWQGTNANGTSQSNSLTNYKPASDGTYYLRAYRNGVWSSSSASETIEMPESPDAPTYSSTSPTCFEPNGGSITITGNYFAKAIPVESDISYSYDNGQTFVSSKTKTNLPAGTYLIRVKNEYDCVSDATEVVLTMSTGPATPVLTNLTVTQPDCDTVDATIVINLSGELEYSFNDGFTYQQSNTRSDLHQNETYDIKVRNKTTGCESGSLSVDIDPQPSTPDFDNSDIIQSNPECGATTGSVTIIYMGANYT